MAQKGTDLDSVSTGGSNRQKISDIIPVFKFPEKKWVTLRLVGPIFTYGGYWVRTKTKDGKPTRFYTPCPSYDPATQQRDSAIYDPWRDLEATQGEGKDDKIVNFTKTGFINAIFRKAQKEKPRKLPKITKKEAKTKFKEMDSDSWTPMVPVRLPFGAVRKLKEQAGLNTVEVKGQTKSFPVTHEKYGCDVRIMFDSSKAPAEQYQVSIGERTKLTDEEKEYLVWDLSALESAPGEAEVQRDFEGWAKRNDIKIKSKKSKKKDEDEDDEDLPDDDGDDDDDDEPKSKKSKKEKAKPAKKSKKSKDEDDEDDDDDSDFDDDDEDDEDDEPKKGKKSKKSKKSDDDDDEDEDDDDSDSDDDDDDEDDEPKSKKSKKPAKKGDDDDEDEDEDEDDEDSDDDDEDSDDDDDDEDDEPKSKKSKKSKKPVKGKKSKSDDDDDDDFDDDEDDDSSDDDDEDEPKSKKSKKPAKKGKKSDDDDEDDDEDSDDDDDDDFDDDEDDEEEEKPKKKAKPAKKGKKSKK